MSHPLVSVIVPVYNMECFLEETLLSILASDYANFEVVVMDDGSKDHSLEIAQRYAQKDTRIHAYHQENAGVCVARNHAISLAKGEFILPIDADDLITPTFISRSVEAINANTNIKVVYSRAEYFGDRQGEWRLPPYSRHLLARKNMISISALYRRADWERVGGYCESIIAREDWEFWISILKDGGEVVKLPTIELKYRIRSSSKRVSDRKLKHHVIDTLNERHANFFQQELGGPLRYHRSWSKVINTINRIFTIQHIVINPIYREHTKFINNIPFQFSQGGETIYHKRNIIKIFTDAGHNIVVKSFQLPILINRMIYGLFRPSKASRSYKYTIQLQKCGIGVPNAIGYIDTWHWGLYSESYFINEKSRLRYKYNDINQCELDKEEVLKAIGEFTAKMHQQHIYHKDYSGGNILFDKQGNHIDIELVDINRMDFGHIGLRKGCKNFERLEATPMMLITMAKSYARYRHFDEQKCIDKVLLYHYKYQKRKCRNTVK